MSKETVLVLTGGGHVHFGPGIKRTIEGALERGWDVYGAKYGWRGVIDQDFVDLGRLSERELNKMYTLGASPLLSSRTKPSEQDLDIIRSNIELYGITSIIALGGDDTHSVNPGIPLVGWPKTMDNNHGPGGYRLPYDLSPGTLFTIGYATAIENAAKQTRESLTNAQTNSSVHIITTFGRDQDFVGVGTTAYGGADFMVPGEIDVDFEDVYRRTVEACVKNAETYGCDPFAVIVVPEGVNKGDAVSLLKDYSAKELPEYIMNNVKKDAFGHPKIKPGIIGEMFVSALTNRSDADDCKIIKKVSSRELTYQLRDGPGIEIDKKWGSAVAEKCLNMIEDGDTGNLATVRFDGVESLYTDKVSLEEARQERFVKDTDFFDYNKLWVPTESFNRYASIFMGGPPNDRGEMLFNPSIYPVPAPPGIASPNTKR